MSIIRCFLTMMSKKILINISRWSLAQSWQNATGRFMSRCARRRMLLISPSPSLACVKKRRSRRWTSKLISTFTQFSTTTPFMSGFTPIPWKCSNTCDPGLTVIVSDGDLYFQAEKIVNSSLADAVEGRVLLFIHKQQHLDEIMQRYPADHYVMIDDKPDILQDAKGLLGELLTTVLVRQGKYGQAPLPKNFTPDITVLHIGDLRSYGAQQFLLAKK